MTVIRKAIAPVPGVVGIIGLAIALGAWSAEAEAGGVVIGAARDNTLFEPDPDFPDDIRSNGAGEHFFVGSTARGLSRRGVIMFDVAGAVPAGATITGVELTLYMSRTLAGEEPVALHPLLADWGEGASDASGEEGEGAPAEPGDATWTHRFFDSDLWTNAGGDFAPTASALALIGDVGFYAWGSTDELVADVQSWLDSPGDNFGWLLLGDEKSPFTSKRFDTRENAMAEYRPALRIEYVPGPGAWMLAVVAAAAPRRRRRG